MDQIIGLRQMAINQSGLVYHLSSYGELGRRLRDMGITPGTRITVKGRAPLKDPVALQVRNCTLTLRNNEADYILVNIGEQNA